MDGRKEEDNNGRTGSAAPLLGEKKLADIWRLSLLSPLRAEVRKCVDNLDSSACSEVSGKF